MRAERPICPRCKQEGIHSSDDACAIALQREINACVARLTRLQPGLFLARWTAYGVAIGVCAPAVEPSIKATGHYVPDFYDY